MKNKIIIMSFTIIVPVFISVLITYFFNISIFLIIGICYSILCFILIPSGDFITTSSNYETKKINPHYSPPVVEKIKTTYFDIVRFVILILLAIGSFYIFFSKYQ